MNSNTRHPNYATQIVNNLASAKAVLKALAKRVIALRNDRWSDFQG